MSTESHQLKIIAIMPVYNCDDVVLTALQSIDGRVDEIRCYDSRWIGHEGPDHSSDNTEKIIREFAEHSKSKVIYAQFPSMHEWEFYNETIKDVADGDWILRYSSDEIVLEWENVRETLANSIEKAYRIYFHIFKNFAATPAARFFKKTATLYNDRNHREIFDKDGWIDVPRAPIIHVVLDHQAESATKKDRKNMEKYETALAVYEQKERKNQSN